MNMPGFTAEASVYKTTGQYHLAAGCGDSPPSFVGAAQLLRRQPIDGDGPPWPGTTGTCAPTCGPCESTDFDPGHGQYGRWRECFRSDCSIFYEPCAGCNPCTPTGSQICCGDANHNNCVTQPCTVCTPCQTCCSAGTCITTC